MSTIELTCTTCSSLFDKRKAEYNRMIRNGKTNFYCCRTCSARRPDNIEHLQKLENRYDITKHSTNKRDEFTPFRYTLNVVRCRCRSGSKELNLTLEDLKNQWEIQQGKCPYTGFDLTLKTSSNAKSNLDIRTASLDRIDNSKGYLADNIQWVSVMFNLARNKFEPEDVVEFAKAVVSKAV